MDELLVIRLMAWLRVPHSLAIPSAPCKASSILELNRPHAVVVCIAPSSTQGVLFSEFLLCLQQPVLVLV